jgi:hypothetical protein
MPSLIMMSIAATRMYRALADFLAPDVYAISPFTLSGYLHAHLVWSISCHRSVDSGNAPRIGPAVPEIKPTFTIPTPPKRVEVAVHTTHEKYPSSPVNRNVFYIGRDDPPQLQRDKPRSLYLDAETE